MKELKTIAVVAVITNLISIVLYFYAANQPGGSGTLLEFIILWMPLLWLISLIIDGTLAIRNRKTLFKKSMLKWSVPLMIFCTPVPVLILYNIKTYSSTYLGSTGYNPSNGYTIKDEEWYYTMNQKPAIHKFFKLNREDYTEVNESEFKRDSLWIYFSTKGDTLKIERYRNGDLLSVINKNK